jgi:hypothetical protein
VKKSLICLAYLTAAALLVQAAGCSKSDSTGDAGRDPLASAAKRLAGEWKGKAPLQMGAEKPKPGAKELEIGCVFKTDGTMTMDLLFPMSGTWEVVKADGDKLTVKTVLEMPSFSSESKMEGDKQQETTKVSTSKETQEFSIVFETDDRIVMSPTDDPDEKGTLERQKK